VSAPSPARDEHRLGGLPPEAALLLLASLGIVTWGTFELLAPSAPFGSLRSAARGTLVLGLIAFGGAGVSVLGASPPRPPASGGPVGSRLRAAFFQIGSSEEAAERHEPVRLGWARMAASVGLLLLLLTAVLSLSPYSAAVLMVIAGSGGVLALRST